MKLVEIDNPFGAPVYYEESVSSTMDVSRCLAERGEPHGTVVLADFQESGRGRSPGSLGNRVWTSGKGENLMFTVLLRFGGFSALPAALTLRAGLAIALALEETFPVLADRVKVKWPNDIMLLSGNTARKTAGILAESLAEAEGALVFLGAGINVHQRIFPEELRDKAVSIDLALEELEASGGALPLPPDVQARPSDTRKALLRKILSRLFYELENPEAESWKTRLEERLYKRGEEVSFIEGAADSGNVVRGRLEGIGGGGELLIVPHGEQAPRAFFTGELSVYSA